VQAKSYPSTLRTFGTIQPTSQAATWVTAICLKISISAVILSSLPYHAAK